VFFSGTGLGLAICRKLVRAMGAELQLETRPQWGTRFYFELCLPTV
jgi:signal transduction histidine kinase